MEEDLGFSLQISSGVLSNLGSCLVAIQRLDVIRFIKVGAQFKISAFRVWANDGHDFEPEETNLGAGPEIMHVAGRVDVLPYRCSATAVRARPMKRGLHIESPDCLVSS